MVLARSVIAWALPAGASAEASCALALATDGRDRETCCRPRRRRRPSQRLSVGFLRGLDATLPDRARALPVARACLTDFVAVALSDFEVAAALSAGCRRRRWACETHEQPCCEHQCRAPAGFDRHWQSPHLPRPLKRKETLPRVLSAAKKGNLRARPGENGAARCSGDARRSRRGAIPQAMARGCEPARSML